MKPDHKKIAIVSALALSLGSLAFAQWQPSDPATPQPNGARGQYSASGRIQQLNYSPDGIVNGFLLGNGTLVNLPPGSAIDPASLRAGSRVSFAGNSRRSPNNRMVVDLQMLSVRGQTINLSANDLGRATNGPAPPRELQAGGPPPPPADRQDGDDAPPPSPRRPVDARGDASPPPPAPPCGPVERPAPPPPPPGL